MPTWVMNASTLLHLTSPQHPFGWFCSQNCNITGNFQNDLQNYTLNTSAWHFQPVCTSQKKKHILVFLSVPGCFSKIPIHSLTTTLTTTFHQDPQHPIEVPRNGHWNQKTSWRVAKWQLYRDMWNAHPALPPVSDRKGWGFNPPWVAIYFSPRLSAAPLQYQ